MSSDDPRWDFYKASEYIRERAVHANCPACGTNRWLLETEPGGLLEFRPRPGYIPFQTGGWGGVPAIPVIVYTCDNCGLIRQHNATHILRKMEGG